MAGLPEILLAEDDAEDAELALAALAQGGFSERAFWVKDGQEALDYVRADGRFAERAGQPSPRVLLLDLKMPRVTGLEVLRALKEDPNTRAVPVVVLTSSRATSDIEQAWAAGANSYVVKPVDFEQFTDALLRVAGYWLKLNVCLNSLER
jgi:two-component system response regulator